MSQPSRSLMRRVLPRVAWGMVEAAAVVVEVIFTFATVITLFVWFFLSMALGHLFVIDVLGLEPSMWRTILGAISTGVIYVAGFIVLEIVEIIVILLLVALLVLVVTGVIGLCKLIAKPFTRQTRS